jgi:hypothetical protein
VIVGGLLTSGVDVAVGREASGVVLVGVTNGEVGLLPVAVAVGDTEFGLVHPHRKIIRINAWIKRLIFVCYTSTESIENPLITNAPPFRHWTYRKNRFHVLAVEHRPYQVRVQCQIIVLCLQWAVHGMPPKLHWGWMFHPNRNTLFLAI